LAIGTACRHQTRRKQLCGSCAADKDLNVVFVPFGMKLTKPSSVIVERDTPTCIWNVSSVRHVHPGVHSGIAEISEDAPEPFTATGQSGIELSAVVSLLFHGQVTRTPLLSRLYLITDSGRAVLAFRASSPVQVGAIRTIHATALHALDLV
jgi:hypothetical protein